MVLGLLAFVAFVAVVAANMWLVLVKLPRVLKPAARRFSRLDRYYDAYTHRWRLKNGRATETTKPPLDENGSP